MTLKLCTDKLFKDNGILDYLQQFRKMTNTNKMWMAISLKIEIRSIASMEKKTEQYSSLLLICLKVSIRKYGYIPILTWGNLSSRLPGEV